MHYQGTETYDISILPPL